MNSLSPLLPVSYQISSWKGQYPKALQHLSSQGVHSFEVGSTFLQNLSVLKDHLDKYEMNVSSVFEFGHFQNMTRKREILWHHNLLARKMSELQIPCIVLAPGLRNRNTLLSQMYQFIDEIIKIYSSYNIKTTIHPHFKQCIFYYEEIKQLLENVNQPLFLLPDTFHLNLANINVPLLIEEFYKSIYGFHIRSLDYVAVISRICEGLDKNCWMIIEEEEKTSPSFNRITQNIQDLKFFYDKRHSLWNYE
ncbi:hypothetical protein QUF84_00095 [Fictibacillus enclensis]|uniref:sugar phosphate isomerase/epimerase family protein n=1 Tax=Fictibacillus enclensis TaxID=1017270 RepID=UPI0025A02377|nr:hypothetical protein [Fictibacillus enclensis]MDM5335696.1 hypothetical protein [Fictibacillus enclensis]